MLLLLAKFSTLASIFKLILLFVIFIGILFAASWFTRWYAESSGMKNRNSNIKIVESVPIGQGKMIYIAKIGEKYIAFAATKDQITVLTELTEDQLEIPPVEIPTGSFKEVFSKMLDKKKE